MALVEEVSKKHLKVRKNRHVTVLDAGPYGLDRKLKSLMDSILPVRAELAIRRGGD